MNIKRLVISIAFVLALLVPGATAFAATCFCNIEGTGAEATGGASDAAACQTVCAGKAKSVGYLWATQVDQGPSSLLQCFSKKELCETDMNDDKVVDGTFDSKQPAECLPGWHYCYPNDTIKYNLQISIPNASGETTSVYNYGEYVGVMYKFLLGIAVTIAIVFVMIGGIRYVIGASTGEIGKAKDMIVKAISGLVLLLFAYVILFTVNPELIKLQVPKLPMIRQVVLLTGGEDCTSLDKKGYEIDWTHATKGKYKAKSCGSVAAVLKDAAGADVAEGTTCVYTECDQVDASCGTYTVGGASAAATCVPSGNAYWCVRCGQVNPDSDCGIPPSSALCSAMDRPDTYVNLVEASPAYDEYNVCGYTHEPSMFSSGGGAAAAMTATVAAGILSGGTAAGVIGAWYTADVALADLVMPDRHFEALVVRGGRAAAHADDHRPGGVVVRRRMVPAQGGAGI